MNSRNILIPFVWIVVHLFYSPLLFSASPEADSVAVDQRSSIEAFLGEELEFDRYVFQPGQFPHVHWKRPANVQAEVGDVPLSVRFFDATFQPVTSPAHSGRYGAVVSGTTAGGFQVVRYVTLYCCDAYFDDYSEELPILVRPLPGFGISRQRWEQYERHQRAFSFGNMLMFPAHDPDAALFLAGLSAMNPENPLETPRIVDRQWWVEFKRREEKAMPVQLPAPPVDPEAPALIDSPGDSLLVYSTADRQRLREICASWADSANGPVVALVAVNGRVVFHEAFGIRSDGTPMTTATPTWMASITKLVTGLLVMRFVDNGSLDLDRPIDSYLPELRSDQECRLTLRNLLTHTSGLSWAGEWASDWNPSLENEVAQAIPFAHPGETFRYNRVGYAVAGKVLERLTGQAVPFLFDRLVFQPLGMLQSWCDNTYGSLYAPALDVARLGQMLLDHGGYSGKRLLSEDAWAAMMPAPLHLEKEERFWGIGTSFLGGDGLSEKTFGHEAASGAILRIDPVHRLVVVLGRNSIGPDYPQYKRFSSRFLHAVASPIR